mgnify:CR=1 FL=1
MSRSPLLRDNGAEDKASIEVNALSVQLGGIRILKDISFTLGPGELVGIIGANGSGKTTLLRCVAGLLRNFGGVVRVNGLSVGEVRRQTLARVVSYMPQRADVHPFTAIETVLMGRYPHLGKFEFESEYDREIALKAMRQTETAHISERRLDSLSGGERQRLLMARVLVQDTPIMLLDEPTSSLDLAHRLAAMDLVKSQVTRKRGITVAAIHDLFLASRYCDRLMLLIDGELFACGTPKHVLTPHNVKQAFGVEVVIEPDSYTGLPSVVLLEQGSHRSRDLFADHKVHVICGAGTGRNLIHRLVAAGYDVTIGALGDGDIDREVADRLKLSYVPVSLFGPIDNQSHARHLDLVRSADYVIMTPIPIGQANVRNMEAAEAAKSLIMIRDGRMADRDHTSDGSATTSYNRLLKDNIAIDENDVLQYLDDLMKHN